MAKTTMINGELESLQIEQWWSLYWLGEQMAWTALRALSIGIEMSLEQARHEQVSFKWDWKAQVR